MKKFLVFTLLSVFLITKQSCSENSNKKDSSETEENKEKKGKLDASDIPAAVVSSFNTKYSGATDVEWKDSKEDGKPSYKAKFKINGIEKKAEFGTDGSFIKEKGD